MPLKAKEDTLCIHCSRLILPGQPTRPLSKDNSIDLNSSKKPQLAWSHLDCVAQDDPRVPICKHWAKITGCIYQNMCYFRHPPREMLPNTTGKSKRHGARQRKRVYNEGRCGSLRRWIVKVLGEEYLRSGYGVIDVAGGKGELSFELLNLNNIPSTVIDPRPLDLYRYKRKLRFGYYHKNDVLGVFNTSSGPSTSTKCVADISISKLPNHIRTYFEVPGVGLLLRKEEEMNNSIPMMLQSKEAFDEALQNGHRTCWTNKGLSHEEDDGDDLNVDLYDDEEEGTNKDREDTTSECTSNTENSISGSNSGSYGMAHRSRPEEGGIEITTWETAYETIKNCSIVIGMHPDQAAEHIIEFCLRNNKPFAVVPCCIYSKQFPQRRMRDGRPVRVYADLIEYLMQKDPQINAISMDFDGKNIMLYYLADREPKSDPLEVNQHISRGQADSNMWKLLSTQPRGSTTTTTAAGAKAVQRLEIHSRRGNTSSSKDIVNNFFDDNSIFSLCNLCSSIDEENEY